MHALSRLVIISVTFCLLPACSSDKQTDRSTENQNVVEIRAVGKTFTGPSEIQSGWTTFRFVNTSSMLHFALIDVPPDSVTLEMSSSELMQPFQDAMDAMNAGDEAAVNAAFGRFPAWLGDLGRMGGPGFLSPGLTGETTVYLEPGRYILECYVKTDGVFHTTSPGEGQIGMMLEMTATENQSDTPEPDANVTIAIRNSGYAIVDGELQAGENVIRVNFEEQQSLPSFVGNDIHVMRVDGDESIGSANDWLDWRLPEGLETPAPATFLGGINDMPAGSHAYITVDLGPGRYAFIAEHPSALESGFVLPFEI